MRYNEKKCLLKGVDAGLLTLENWRLIVQRTSFVTNTSKSFLVMKYVFDGLDMNWLNYQAKPSQYHIYDHSVQIQTIHGMRHPLNLYLCI